MKWRSLPYSSVAMAAFSSFSSCASDVKDSTVWRRTSFSRRKHDTSDPPACTSALAIAAVKMGGHEMKKGGQ